MHTVRKFCRSTKLRKRLYEFQSKFMTNSYGIDTRKKRALQGLDFFFLLFSFFLFYFHLFIYYFSAIVIKLCCKICIDFYKSNDTKPLVKRRIQVMKVIILI